MKEGNNSLPPIEVSKGYFVSPADGTPAVWLYRLLTLAAAAVQVPLAAFFIVLPRAWFQGPFFAELIHWGSARWPKLASDYAELLASNTSFANKFAVFNIVAASVCLVIAIALAPALMFSLARTRRSLDSSFRNPLKPALVVGVFGIAVWFMFFLSTPFHRFTMSEPVLVYMALFWTALQIFIANFVAMVSKAIFARPS